jgi:hypothetical protein
VEFIRCPFEQAIDVSQGLVPLFGWCLAIGHEQGAGLIEGPGDQRRDGIVDLASDASPFLLLQSECSSQEIAHLLRLLFALVANLFQPGKLRFQLGRHIGERLTEDPHLAAADRLEIGAEVAALQRIGLAGKGADGPGGELACDHREREDDGGCEGQHDCPLLVERPGIGSRGGAGDNHRPGNRLELHGGIDGDPVDSFGVANRDVVGRAGHRESYDIAIPLEEGIAVSHDP